MTLNARNRLQEMIRQVDPSLQAVGLHEILESQGSTSSGSALDATAPGIVNAEAQLALDSLEVLRKGDEIDEESRFALEAIVMPFHRPVVDIINNAIALPQLTNKWNHLGQGAGKARIERTFLSIGRVEIPQHPSLPYAGTGFVVGRNTGGRYLLMTNRHVAELFAKGIGTKNVQFIAGQKAEVDFFREHSSPATESFHVDRVVMIHPFWDMALVEVSGLSATREPLQLLTDDPNSLKDREVVTIGYPGYDPTGDAVYQQTLARVFRGVYYVKRMQPGIYRIREQVSSYDRSVSAITHDCSTLGGNSGSAVIDVATGQVVGLHFAGAYLRANYAVTPHDLAQDSRVVDTGINFSRSLTPSSHYAPYWQVADRNGTEMIQPSTSAGPGTGTSVQSPPAVISPSATSIAAPRVHADPRATAASSTVEIEIPLKVAISLDASKVVSAATPVLPAREVEFEGDSVEEGSVPARGFDVDFLSTRVSPPGMKPTHLNDSVRVNNAPLIHHTHFSVCQSISRRLPRFVAWNFDGGRLKSLSRNGLDFVFDDQIPHEFQVGDELYKNNDYDRGHMARRADLVWGSTAEAKRANRESFYFTNITPQHKRFNQSGLAGLWGELENAIFEDVDVRDLRISVIAGPVFKSDDPVYRGVRIPRDFWKLIAFDDDADGRFKVAAYLLSQRDLIITEALELDDFQLHQVSLAQLSTETGLDFTHLAAHDTFVAANEAMAVVETFSEGQAMSASQRGSANRQREIGSRDQLLSWKPRPTASIESTSRTSRPMAAPFNLSSLATTSFSWQTALAMAHCSKLAYEQPDSVNHIAINSWGFQATRFIEVGDTQCFVATTPQAIVVSFRGTHNVPDWITNLTLFSTARPYGNVHRGFAKAFDLVKTALHAQLTASGGPARKLLLTGHSLGGALATIAAAEFQSEFNIEGIYTYGQPRLGKEDFQQFIARHYANRFHRIVNDDDIVSRIPPGYEHVGKHYHLDADGSLLESLEQAVGGPVESPPLTEPEFETMRRTLRNAQLAARASSEMGDEREVVGATAEGLFPSFSDHKIEHYISKIRRLAIGEPGRSESISTVPGGIGAAESTITATAETLRRNLPVQYWAQSKKIDLELEMLCQAELTSIDMNQFDSTVTTQRTSPAAGNHPAQGSPVLLRLSTPDWTAPDGMTIHSRIGKFATARCTVSQLEQLRNDPSVLGIEASRDAGVPEVEQSVSFIGATNVHKPPTSETGADAIVGLIDSGIDILHEAFLDPARQTRILGIWNQRETAVAGSPFQSPKKRFPGVFTQDYGVIYLKSDIDAFLSTNPPSVPLMLRDPGPGGSPGHGTHVASIAAGLAAGDFKGGVAPDAKILAVIPNMVTSPTDPPSLGYSNSHVDALSFLITAAKAAAIGNGLPIVINVSLGMNAGAHDGLSLLEASFDAATNNGREEGVVIVKSAGNEGDSSGHAELQAFVGTQFISWDSSASYRQRDYIEVWYNSQHELEFTLIDPTGTRSPTVRAANPTASVSLGGNRCTLLLTEFHPDCGDHRLQITITPETAAIQAGTWSLEVTGLAVGGGSQSIHAWVERDVARAVRFLTGDNAAMTLSVPGTAKHVIAVTASGSKTPLTLTPSSSQGLTRDGRPKPDLCAPGTGVIAAASNTNNRSEVIAMTGTSMAAPHVTGAVALAFSLRKRLGKRQLTANQVASILRRSSTGGNGAHNRAFGFGCLNAKDFLQAVVNLP